jgi:hypothetical protein
MQPGFRRHARPVQARGENMLRSEKCPLTETAMRSGGKTADEPRSTASDFRRAASVCAPPAIRTAGGAGWPEGLLDAA